MCVHSRRQCKYRPSVYTITLLLIRFVIGRLTERFLNGVTPSSILAVILSISPEKILYSANINTVDHRCPLENNRINRFLINLSAKYNVRVCWVLLRLFNACNMLCSIFVRIHMKVCITIFKQKCFRYK